MGDPYANQYPPPLMHDRHGHQKYSQSPPYCHQQPDPAYYPRTDQENYYQNPGMIGTGQEHHQGDYYAASASIRCCHNPQPQPQQQHVNYIPNNDPYYYEPEYFSPLAHAPMVQQYAYKGPTLAPVDESDAYRPKPYRPEHSHGRCCRCCCCCYNPAMTCYSCFCMLISIAFIAVGIGLILTSTIIQPKCDNKCNEVPEEYRAETACGIICGKVVHGSLFYSGIGITALAGLGVIWHLFTWTWAGYSKH